MVKNGFSGITPKILTFECYAKNKTYSEVHFICVYQVWSKLIEKCPSKIQDGRHEIYFFVISTSDRGDFPRIIMIALFLVLFISKCTKMYWCLKLICNNLKNEIRLIHVDLETCNCCKLKISYEINVKVISEKWITTSLISSNFGTRKYVLEIHIYKGLFKYNLTSMFS